MEEEMVVMVVEGTETEAMVVEGTADTAVVVVEETEDMVVDVTEMVVTEETNTEVAVEDIEVRQFPFLMVILIIPISGIPSIAQDEDEFPTSSSKLKGIGLLYNKYLCFQLSNTAQLMKEDMFTQNLSSNGVLYG